MPLRLSVGVTPVLRLLGPVRWETAAGQLDLGTVKQRTVLAALAVESGRLVAWAELVDRVWDGASSTGSHRALYTYVSRIRRLLEALDGAADHGGPVRLARRSGGYLLHLDPDEVDLHRFHRLAAAADDSRCPDGERARLLSEALALWHGRPLADLPGDWAARNREAWCRRRLDVMVAWAEARVRLGEPAAVIGPVQELAAEYPLAEPLTGVLIRALVAAGRDADALHCYAAYRARVIDELGAEPGAELRDLHEAVLRATVPRSRRASSTLAPALARATEAGRPVPAQLPADTPGFAGRLAELTTLDSLLPWPGGGPQERYAEHAVATAVVISAVSGSAGVGKTALVIHWAHRVADRFPDGQLYVNLRGFDPGGRVVEPAEAVRGFLDALGVPSERVPLGLDPQAALYRSLLAGRRMLVVLDNARDAEQVLPLLPGTPTALAVVTSRNQLTSLVAAQAAHPVMLDLLTPAEASELLVRRLGADRVAAEPEAVDQIIARCARLPLALTIAAARAAQSGFPLASLAEELAVTEGRLDALSAGEPGSRLRAVFSWSYATLSPGAARLFRLLGLHPRPDITAAAAGSLAGCAPAAVRALLAELAGASLLAERVPGRYTCHDLLRAYAGELALSLDSDGERHAAIRRMLDHYLHGAHNADRVLNRARDRMPLPLQEPAPGATAENHADHARAMAWFDVEQPTLLAAVDHALAHGLDTHGWQLAWSLDTFLYRQGHWHELALTWQAALAAAGRLADPSAQAYAQRSLARVATRQGRYQDALAHHQQALQMYTRAGDLAGQAYTHHVLAMLWERQHLPDRALDHARHALALYQAAGHQRGQAAAYNAVGWYHALLGDHHNALTFCQRALALHQQLGDRDGEAHTWDSLGYAHHLAGHHPEAADRYQHALDLFHELGDHYQQAASLARLGDTHLAAGDHTAAHGAWQHALDILSDLDHAEADTLRQRLIQLLPG